MTHRQIYVPHNHAERSPSEIETFPRKPNMDEQQPFRCMPSSFELPSNHLNTPWSFSEANVGPQLTAANAKQDRKNPTFMSIAEANWDALKTTLTLKLKGCVAVLVGNSTTIQYQSNCEDCSHGGQRQTNSFDGGKVQTTSDSEILDGSLAERTEMSAKQNRKHIEECEERTQKQNLSAESLGLNVELSLPLIKKQGYLNGSQCERIMEQLEILQDNGKFQKHKRLVDSYLNRCKDRKSTHMGSTKETQQNLNDVRGAQCEKALKKLELLQNNGKLDKNENLFSLYSRLCQEGENADMELSLIIEQAVSFMYQKEFKKSKLFLTSVIELGNYCQLRNPAILIARAKFLLAENHTHMYDKDKKIQSLLKCLEHSEGLLQHHDSPEDWAELYYNYGSVWLAIMSTIPDDERRAQARKHARENARSYYERAIDFCQKDPRLRVQIKKLTYCHLGAAAVLLDCTSTAARSRRKRITPNDIKDAQSHLDFVERVLGESLPLGSRMHLYKTRSDQYYRQGFYQRAKETAEHALQIASIYGFKTELVTLQERINFLNQCLEDDIRLMADNDKDSNSDNDASSEASCS